MDLISEKVTHFVVQMDRHGKEVLAPLDLVDFVDRSLIHLTCSRDEASKLAEFQKSYFNGYDSYDGSPPVPSYAVRATSTLYHPRRLADTAGQEVGTQSPEILVAVNKGAKVLATDGYVGKVDEFVVDSESHQITHFVIRDHNLLDKWTIT